MTKKFKLVSFDMDGTLTIGTTCLQYYVKILGQEEKAVKLEKKYKDHVIDDYEVADRYAEILKGTSKEQFNNWTEEIPRIKNIDKAIKDLKYSGLIVGITSVGPIFACEYFQKEFGFDFISGSEHEFVNGIHSGKMVYTLASNDKVLILEKICKERNIEMDRVIAVGDSRSDIPIFKKAGLSIALNADENLRGITNISLQSDNLVNVSEKIINELNDI